MQGHGQSRIILQALVMYQIQNNLHTILEEYK